MKQYKSKQGIMKNVKKGEILFVEKDDWRYVGFFLNNKLLSRRRFIEWADYGQRFVHRDYNPYLDGFTYSRFPRTKRKNK